MRGTAMNEGITKLFGLFGHPVAHSISPLIHNRAFAHLKMNARYVAFDVEPRRLKEAVEAIVACDMRGVNVTVPHKETVMRFLDHIDPQARAIGAVNTIVNARGVLYGYNTDGIGFAESLEKDSRIRIAKNSFFIIGAGGGAKAISFFLLKSRAPALYIYDIDVRKGKNLVKKLRRHFPRARVEFKDPAYARSLARVLVNATPLGLHKGDPLAIDAALIGGTIRHAVDLIYNPVVTPFLACAKKKGISISNGMGMLLRQAAHSFYLWNGRYPSLPAMRAAAASFIKGKGRHG